MCLIHLEAKTAVSYTFKTNQQDQKSYSYFSLLFSYICTY